jgi:tryptophanyl-tRNA synthetase
MLFERIDSEVGPLRERYDTLVGNPQEIERILRRGAEKARARATPFMAELRDAVGLRNLAEQGKAAKKGASKTALPSFKQYREADGLHHFKFVDAGGRLLAQSMGFASPQEAGRAVARLKQGDTADLGQAVHLADGVSDADLRQALGLFASA